MGELVRFVRAGLGGLVLFNIDHYYHLTQALWIF